MKVTIDEMSCVGCGTCAHMMPGVFEVDGVARVKGEGGREIQEVMMSCPCGAIRVG